MWSGLDIPGFIPVPRWFRPGTGTLIVGLLATGSGLVTPAVAAQSVATQDVATHNIATQAVTTSAVTTSAALHDSNTDGGDGFTGRITGSDTDDHLQASVTDTMMLPGEPLVEGLENAFAMVHRPDDELIITEPDADRIASYRMFYDELDDEETKESELPDLDRPQGLSLQAGIYPVVISAGSSQVHLLDEDLSYHKTLSIPSWATGDQGFTPADVTTNTIGEIYVLDTNHNRIYHFNANGNYIQDLRLDNMERPFALTYAEESLFVSDAETGLVHVLTENGHELARIGGFPDLFRVRVVDRRIWVLSGSVVHGFDIYGEHIGNWRMEDVDEPLRDLAIIGDQLFLLTPGSLYYSGSLK